MKANIEIDGTDVTIWLCYKGKTIHTSYEVDPDIMGYTFESKELDDFAKNLSEAGEMTDALFVAMEDLENAVAAVAYLSMLNATKDSNE